MTLQVIFESNLLPVAAVQLIWFACLAYYLGEVKPGRTLVLGIVAGIPIGALFDVVIGRYNDIFHYNGLENDHLFMIANGAFSYGPAVATAALITRPIDEARAQHHEWLLTGLFVFSFVAIYVTAFLDLSTLSKMFLLGSALLVLFEVTLQAFGQASPIVMLFRNEKREFAQLYLLSISTGIVYEIANFLRPLWFWEFAKETSILNIALIIVLGYFVLMHPLLAVTRLVRSFRQQRTHRGDKL